MKTKQPNKSLATCTYDELLRFKRDGVRLRGWHIEAADLPDICIGRWPRGQDMWIPRPIFNRLIREYLKPRRFVRRPI